MGTQSLQMVKILVCWSVRSEGCGWAPLASASLPTSVQRIRPPAFAPLISVNRVTNKMNAFPSPVFLYLVAHWNQMGSF